MPMVKERLRRATAMSAPSLAMPCRRRTGRTALFFVAFIRSHKIDLNPLKVHFKILYRINISEFPSVAHPLLTCCPTLTDHLGHLRSLVKNPPNALFKGNAVR